MNANDGLPAAFALMGTRAHDKVAIRLAGGCKGMGPDDKRQMLTFFDEAFRGYGGVIWSGGTRQVAENGQIDPMITDVPGVVAAANPGCVALGTIPRTALLSLQEDSRLVLDEWGTAPNPDMQGILIVQNGPDGEMGWDGDLDVYFRLMQNWQEYAGFTALGLVAWNGGPVTKDEILRALGLGWPVYLIEDSGRATDEVIGMMNAGDPAIPKRNRGTIIRKSEADTLASYLEQDGFLP